MPYMWPDDRMLQFRLFVCIILLAGVRVINVFVPIYFKMVVDELMEGNYWPWQSILIWGVLRLLQGGGSWSMGILNNLRLFLWIRVQQHNSYALQTHLLKHIQTLSLRWHQTSQIGRTTRIMDRGVKAVNRLVEYIVFSITPTIVDIITAVVYFVLTFNLYFGLIMLISMIFYFACTWLITDWRNKFRREMNIFDNNQRAIGVDSLINAETVKYFSMEEYEVKRYGQAVNVYQDMEWKSTAALQLLNLVQTIILNIGLFGTALYCALLVQQQLLTVGDFSLVVSYFLQLMSPLSFLGTVYRLIQESFINTENMLDLLDVQIEIQDVPGAQVLNNTTSPPKLEFRHLCFYYDSSNPIIKDVSFTIPAGTSTAIVGASGFGKSTLSKLIFRLYDPVHGCILINGEDIRTYKQNSYRSVISVVPQEVILFNETVLYNIAYGRLSATEKDIEDAAKMANIHDTIISFPNGYQTIVGDRGLKLSGGEKQRVAIARALIKNPKVLIFDEATSALDTETEMHIQRAVEDASKLRTVLIIAHRLSTIMFCDQILVLEEGRIVEQGKHHDLIDMGGKYANLWNIQAHAVNEDY